MEHPVAYIPTDRRIAMTQGGELPEHRNGAALFADISGFTPLTEALVQALGPQRGAEELPIRLNMIYDALIGETDRYGGSVLGFSGDAITCWFAETPQPEQPPAPDTTAPSPAAHRAAACALAMQQVMKQFAALEINGVGTVTMAIKIAVTCGPARRFIVGNPQVQLIDVLAGETIARLATAEHLAERGDVIIDSACMEALGAAAGILTWRTDAESDQSFAVLQELRADVLPQPWPPIEQTHLDDAQLRPWLLQPVYDRLHSGMGEFLTELRPAVALFVRFGGIDYDNDPQAGAKLNTYISWALQVISNYGGYLLQLTIGDKGSYFYAAFGAPLAYENNASRAMHAALELVALPPDLAYIGAVQIGISQGRMRTGAYGGLTRRTYGVLGDDVNMAARLMQAARPGQVYVSAHARRATGDDFLWWNLPPMQVKGKSQPVTAFRLLDIQERQTIRLQEPKYTLAMVGRESELRRIDAELDRVAQHQGRILGITAEAGMGKSRLVAELIRRSQVRHVVGFGGECQSYGTNTSYLVWQNIWRSFFGITPGMEPDNQIAVVSDQLRRLDPTLLPRLPLLGAVLNVPIPDTELTASFDAKLRKESLEALLVDCVRARTREVTLLFVLEDCHWLDPLSHDLLEVIARAITDLPVLLVMAYRPPQLQRLMALRVVSLGHFSEIVLENLPDHEIAQLMQARLRHLYGEGAVLAHPLTEQLAQRAQGNPFYIEELLNYLRDRGLDPQDPNAFQAIDLPASLHSLILSRIDQLSENQKTVLKVASVIGRLFRVAMLWGVYNQFGNHDRVRSDLDLLSEMELTPLDTPDPELAYLFKHILTQEVAYETLPFTTRNMLHEQIGHYIERTYSSELEQYVDLLAYHFDRSRNTAKRREYLLKAGKSAQAAYANTAAIDYYRRVLDLLSEADRAPVLLRLGQVQELVGDWQAADESNRQAADLAEGQADLRNLTEARRALGWLLRKRGTYPEAEAWMNRARVGYRQLDDVAGLSHILADIGEIYRLRGMYSEARDYYKQSLSLAMRVTDPIKQQAARAHALRGAATVATWQGDYTEARTLNDESLALRRALGDTPQVAVLLNNQGIVARFQRDLEAARRMNDESLALFREIGDRWAVGQLLNNQACVAADQHAYAEARTLLEESLSIRRQLGDQAGLALSLNTLADVMIDEGDFASVRPLLDESLAINRELGDQTAIAYLIEDYAGLAAARNQPEHALQLAGFAAGLRDTIGAPLPPSELARVERMIAPAVSALSDTADILQAQGRAMSQEQAIALITAMAY